MARNTRPRFDREQDFIVVRSMLAAGKNFAAGDPFDKALVPERRLRQMYDLRILDQVAPPPRRRRFLRREVTAQEGG
jgi:hypothetical protein